MFTYDTANKNDNDRSTDRILMLAPIAGKATKSSEGFTDNRLFTGENKLHAVLDKEHMLWYLRMDSGLLAQELKQKFTSFSMLRKFVTDYYLRRNIEVKEVID